MGLNRAVGVAPIGVCGMADLYTAGGFEPGGSQPRRLPSHLTAYDMLSDDGQTYRATLNNCGHAGTQNADPITDIPA